MRQFLLLILMALALNAGTAIPETIQEPNWERTEALHAIEHTDTHQTRSQLARLATGPDSAALLQLLRTTATRDDWPMPARESVLHDFANSLRAAPPHSVAPEVIEYLASYPSQVLVRHEDHPQSAVPLFNVRAEAGGVRNHWRRQEAAFSGTGYMAQDPALLVEAFAATEDIPTRRGFEDALESAAQDQLMVVAELALEAMERAPGLAELAGRAALLSRNAEALERFVRHATGAPVGHVLRESAVLLPTDQLNSLLHSAIAAPEPQTAAIAIAELMPALWGSPGIEEVLLELLADPQLGSSAALALAQHAGTSTLNRLSELAQADEDGISTQRARLALELNRTQFTGGVRQ